MLALRHFVPLLHFFLLQSCLSLAATQVVTVPKAPSHSVPSNMFGLSIELSFVDYYFGNTTSTIPTAMMNHLSQVKSRLSPGTSFRMRIGGNSADSSIYNPSQTVMLNLTDPNANANNQPVTYGPVLWDVMEQVSQDIGGASYLIGLSLDANNSDAVVAAAAKKVLGDKIDAMLAGNEPDLYTAHGERPGLANYTVDDYFGEFQSVVTELHTTSDGDVLSSPALGGPTICCNWDLATLLQSGYVGKFWNALKYITLQHYPENDCSGTFPFGTSWFMQHANTVNLATWQKPGVDIVLSNTSTSAAQMVMTEFNSASCGGIPGVSNTFAVGSLWTIDYVLQLASVGYSAAYMHTREAGISYNIVTPPSNVNGPWTTNSPFYSLLVTAEILESSDNVKVADLNLGGSMTNPNITAGGYAIYDGANSTAIRLAMFNYGSTATQFTLPSNLVPANSNVSIKFLSAASANETTKIAYGGLTFDGVPDGKPVTAPAGSTWAAPDQSMECGNGCTFTAPGPSLAVVFFQPLPNTTTTTLTQNSTNPSASSTDPSTPSTTKGSGALSLASLTRTFLLSVVSLNALIVFSLV